jgi:hypothetical protein
VRSLSGETKELVRLRRVTQPPRRSKSASSALATSLEEGKVAVMSKLQTHEIERTCETSERRSYRVFSLPYSVGLNLVGKAFSEDHEPAARAGGSYCQATGEYG